MKKKFEKIFEQLADFHMLSGYDGWMIGACIYEQSEMKNSCKSEIVKQSQNFAVMRNQLEFEGLYYQLELHIVKPKGYVDEKRDNHLSVPEVSEANLQSGSEREDDTDKSLVIFSHLDILRFVEAVGDTNPIHRKNHAVVPGLLMVKWMLENLFEHGDFEKTKECKELKCQFRFKKPVFAGDKLHVELPMEHKKQIYECKREDNEIVWNMRIL